MRRARCILQEPALTARALAGGDNIKAGQSDGKRKQVDLDAHDEAARDVHAVLQQQGELAGRRPAEWRALHSQPGCKRQKRHWDYNPNEVRNLRQLGLRVPCSVIAAMQDGAQLLVWDHERGVEVPVVMFAGDVLVFDGDVVHAGAQYSVGSTRVHVYLDVPELERDGIGEAAIAGLCPFISGQTRFGYTGQVTRIEVRLRPKRGQSPALRYDFETPHSPRCRASSDGGLVSRGTGRQGFVNTDRVWWVCMSKIPAM